MNTADWIESEFERLAQSPEGIPKLREFVLQLAVQGKLVPQDPNDEPASELLKRIAAEKEQLVKDGKIKKPKSLPDIEGDEIPFEIPQSWEWVRLRSATRDLGQEKPANKFTYIDVSSIDKRKGIITDKVETILPENAPSRARKLVDNGTVIYSTVRPYLLNIAIVDRPFTPQPIVSTAFFVLHPFEGVQNKYLYFFLRSSPFISFVEQKMRGQAYPAINDKEMSMALFPIPPLAEQHRIVAKVDELMALCDELEAKQTAKAQTKEALNGAALHHVRSATDPAELESATRFYVGQMDTLADVPQAIPPIRETILQLAVQGKLVPQDPNDEPASELLKRIAAEKEQLIKDGKIKKPKPLPDIDEDEIPFEIPEGWFQCRVGSVVDFLNGYAFKSTWFSKDGVRLIRNVNIGHGEVDWKETAKIPNRMAKEYERFSLESGDLLISLDRPIISTGLKVTILNELDVPSLLLQRVAKVTPMAECANRKYLFNWFNSPDFMETIKPGRSNGVPHISTKQVEHMVFGLPPIPEQHRIVAKVDELMGLCDQLEARLTTARDLNQQLTQAILAQTA